MGLEDKKYTTIQIRKGVKAQIVDYCQRRDLKIGRFMETLFLQKVSGSLA